MAKDEVLRRIGERVRELRKTKGFSLQEVAKRSGVTTSLLSKVENFKTKPSLVALLSIADALDVSMADLVENVNNEARPDFLLMRREGLPQQRAGKVTTEFVLSLKLARWRQADVSIVTLRGHSPRVPLVATGQRIIHVLCGKPRFSLNDSRLELAPGDTLYCYNGGEAYARNREAEECQFFHLLVSR